MAELFYEEENIQLFLGDARSWLPTLEAGSVDLVLTDLVYDRREDYEWLAGEARRLLAPPGALLCWSNGRWHRRNADWLEAAGLTYRWDFACVISTGPAPMNGRIIAKTNRLLWFDVDRQSRMGDYLADGYASVTISRLHSDWGWTKNPVFMEQAVRAFTPDDGLVIDPFAGCGSSLASAKSAGRRAAGIEQDEGRCARAANRLRATPRPLFALPPEPPRQGELGL